MSDIKLSYFNARGRAETARLILAHAGGDGGDCMRWRMKDCCCQVSATLTRDLLLTSSPRWSQGCPMASCPPSSLRARSSAPPWPSRGRSQPRPHRSHLCSGLQVPGRQVRSGRQHQPPESSGRWDREGSRAKYKYIAIMISIQWEDWFYW